MNIFGEERLNLTVLSSFYPRVSAFIRGEYLFLAFAHDLFQKRLLISRAKREPVRFSGLGESVPVLFKTLGKLFYVSVQRLDISDCAEVITICFVLRQANDLPIAQLKQHIHHSRRNAADFIDALADERISWTNKWRVWRKVW